MSHSWCWMIFRASKVDDGIDVEILECAAGNIGFQMMGKSDYENKKSYRSVDEWYYECWNESDYKDEIALEIAKELSLSGDHYFEYVGDYEVISSRDYYGEYDEEERISNDAWQEISYEEYKDKFQ